ncbi:MAG: zf-TFIIB domain-containing protein [Gemmatimonas sp.]
MAIESTPSRNEDEYFARVDAELRKQLRDRADAERAALIAAERNKCPRDGSALVAKEHNHVTIDQCPQCGGLWLDKGELEILAGGNAEQGGFVASLLNIFK